MAIIFDYFRLGRPMSPRASGYLCLAAPKPLRGAAALVAAALLTTFPAAAQYAGKVPESPKKNGPDLRAVAVLEWTGDPGKPKASRLVPIALWDGQDLQDASIYMAQPAPLALQSEVEYKLEQNGKTIGYYDISSAGQSQGTWVGFGSWKSLTPPKPPAPPQKIEEAGDDSGPPVLHRKNQPEAGGKPSAPAPAPDPDRPTLHQPAQPSKPAAEKPNDGEGYSEPIASEPDPDRPHLFHGKASSTGGQILPTLAGLPPEMHQTIAVSDARNHPDHEWTYSWANTDDEAKMKSELEDLARKAIAPPTPPAPSKPTERRRTTTARHHTKPAPPPQPMPLQDEQFHVFQLTYGGPATMVFSAHVQVPVASAASAADETRPPTKAGGRGKISDEDEIRPPLKGGATGKVSDVGESGASSQTGATQEKFITLIAQPDLYGNVRVLFKNITDASNLDDTPAMRLIDPVDAMADNRGELLFELRGATQRQFALYRVISGRVEKLFTTSPESVAMPAGPSS